jgi:hypothetical protein
MDAILVATALFGSFLAALFLQRAALRGLFRVMGTSRRQRM